MRIETYYNLHKHCLSYRPPGGKVQHAKAMIVNNVKFVVQPAGNAKVRREGKKNVHAFVRGEPVWIADLEDDLGDYTPSNMVRHKFRRVTYNPYKHESFVMADTELPLTHATQVVIIGKDIYLSGTGWKVDK